MSNLIQVLHIASANFILRVACLAAAARLILKTRTQRILLYGNCEITVTQHLGRRLDSELLAYVKCVMRWLQVGGTFSLRKNLKSSKLNLQAEYPSQILKDSLGPSKYVKKHGL